MPTTLARLETFPVRLPYHRPIKWASVQEDGADYLILKLTTSEGVVGVAEGTVKPTWTGATLRSLMVVFEELFVPRLAGVDLSDPAAVRKAIGGLPGHEIAKAMIDTASWDIVSQLQGKPLWQMWGGTPTVPVSCSVTRQSLERMAAEAQQMTQGQGVRALKLKGGQGVEEDCANVRAIRDAVGDQVILYVDTNSAYRAETVPDYVARLAEFDVRMVEDPCKLMPTEGFAELQGLCPMPIIVDDGCTGALMARLFLDRGAQSLVLKTGRFGFSENRAMAQLAAEKGCEVHVNVLGGSSLATIASLQLAAAVHGRNNVLPAEAAFFVQLREEYVYQPITIQDGCISLPAAPGFHRFIDWDRVQRLRPN